MVKKLKISDTWEVRTLAGYPIGLAGQRLNHSAKVSNYAIRALSVTFKGVSAKMLGCISITKKLTIILKSRQSYQDTLQFLNVDKIF